MKANHVGMSKHLLGPELCPRHDRRPNCAPGSTDAVHHDPHLPLLKNYVKLFLMFSSNEEEKEHKKREKMPAPDFLFLFSLSLDWR